MKNVKHTPTQIFKVTPDWNNKAYINQARYQELYRLSIQDPESFWAEQAERLTWLQKWHTVKKTNFQKPVEIGWYLGGKLNVCYNCVDRHLSKNANRVAFHWQPEDPKAPVKSITYQSLFEEVSRMANVLKMLGVKKGSRVTIYMPMIPEAVYGMLACARIGAVHSVVFGGFSPESLGGRIEDCASEFLITADEGIRGGKTLGLKKNADLAATVAPILKKILVIRHTGGPVSMQAGRDVWYHEAAQTVSTDCPPEPMDAEDPLFILYTSGSTNKPKGVLHTTGGYLVYASFTHEIVFDYHPQDVYWCAADIGWVTGHTYILYGPLANGATSILYEGLPTYPTASRLWEIIDKFKVSILYTAPTLIRTLMGLGEEFVQKTARTSLRLLGSVGEPINPEAWLWYHHNAGRDACPIVDTWWQTETGGILISPLPGATDLKPGSATLPLFGIKPMIVDDKGHELQGACEGNLCIADSWPGQMRTVYKDHERFYQTYFSQYPGKYFTGDGCRRDEDGYYWITGRVDDVLNVSGHRIGTAEVESALVADHHVAEAAVVGFPHDLKGQGIYAYVTLKNGVEASETLKRELVQTVRKEIGGLAVPDVIQWAPGLPKTRSGKIMRRILRKIAENNFENLGDVSTLADPTVVDSLIKNRVQP